jgi:anaerobic dimethyl sulfoxide reductase subunit B (iron-sulfur subunit)
MTQYGFYFDGRRCTGCKTCEMACKDYNDLSTDFAYRKIYEFVGGGWTTDEKGHPIPQNVYTYFVSVACNHCDNPACTKVCPTGAMHKDPDTGLVSVDTNRCVGCGYCAMACPYNAPKVDREKGHSVKCDGCQNRVAQGLDPICVEACSTRALKFGPVDEVSELGDRADIAPLPSVEVTHPNLYIKPHRDAKPSNFNDGVRSSDGYVANPLEVE